jgi:hypothetical protein
MHRKLPELVEICIKYCQYYSGDNYKLQKCYDACLKIGEVRNEQ